MPLVNCGVKTTKVLSLLQPWASLVIMGLKQIETRSWTTDYRGTLLIHASAGKAGKFIAENEAIKKHIPDYKSLPFGYIIGQVQLTDIVRVSELNLVPEEIDRLSLEEKAFGDNGSRYAWLFSEAEAFEELIPATGRLGLWEF
jgi:hypothetical protein